MALYNALYALHLALTNRLPLLAVLNAVEQESSATHLPNATTSAGDMGKAVLNILLAPGNEDVDFGSAAWFLWSQCQAYVREALRTGSEGGWELYLTDCIGTTVTESRRALWIATRDLLVQD